ncbi:DUF3226 domain-containing protein [Pseudocitrobacter faecalis]|uniref:DUF3226 domain-containing protein n=1 Tax=Pseudocitrobacter faecalis TaxID=1398493 RepID=UPI004063EF26
MMPDNKSDGTIEDWIKDKIVEKDSALFAHACKIVKELPVAKFSANSKSKAEIATWLAWQNQPGRTIAYSLKDGNELLDMNCNSYKELVAWLTNFFTD